jgi:excisionase family DNA binding protein
MKTLTIRQASEAMGRAPATIRRYIKAGRLPAEKEPGKFGEEFRIREEDLQGLGWVRGESETIPAASAPAPLPARWALNDAAQRWVPRDLFQELVMKHERLLVQYGMVRAGGVKLLEARADLEMKDSLLAEREREIREVKERSEKEIGFLQNHLRQAEIEIEDRNIEIALLQEKLRRLEMAAASSEAVRSFDEEIRVMAELEEGPPQASEGAPRLPDIRKIDALEDWLRACQTGKGRETP